MSAPSYMRYTLRLPAWGGSPEHRVAGGRSAVAEAASLLAGLPTPGWQEEPDDGRLVFWLPATSLSDPSVRLTIERLSLLGGLSAEPESDEWEHRWRSFHHPVRVGRVLVRPPWAVPEDGLLDVVVDVGMAFGTGGHATTRQCLELLQHVDPGPLLDVGCGSGVLAIAACRLGFHPVEAVDIDELATSAAAANALLNGVSFRLHLADATAASAGPDPSRFDVVVANVALGPIVALGRRVRAARGPRDVILAGLLAHQVDEALAAWPGHEPADHRSEGQWVALLLRRTLRERSWGESTREV